MFTFLRETRLYKLIDLYHLSTDLVFFYIFNNKKMKANICFLQNVNSSGTPVQSGNNFIGAYPVHPGFPTSISLQTPQPPGTSQTGQIYFQPVITNTIVAQPVMATIQPSTQEISSVRTEPQLVTVSSETGKEIALDDVQNIQILQNVIVPPLKPALLISQEFPQSKDNLTVDDFESSDRKESTVSVKSFSSQVSDSIQYTELPGHQLIAEQPFLNVEKKQNEIKENVSTSYSQLDGHVEQSQELLQSEGQDKSVRIDNIESSQSTSPVHGNYVPDNLPVGLEGLEGQATPVENQQWEYQTYDSQPITPVADFLNFDYPKDCPTDEQSSSEPPTEVMDKEETKLERTESSKSRKSSMIKRKSRPMGPKLSVLSLTGSTIECQLETSKHQTVTFTFETGDAVPSDIANNLVSLIIPLLITS